MLPESILSSWIPFPYHVGLLSPGGLSYFLSFCLLTLKIPRDFSLLRLARFYLEAFHKLGQLDHPANCSVQIIQNGLPADIKTWSLPGT
jgi:hypothetical protein